MTRFTSDLERNRPLRELLSSKSASNVHLSHVPLKYAQDAREKLRGVQLFDYGWVVSYYEGGAPGLIVAHANAGACPLRKLQTGRGEFVMQHLTHYPWVIAQSPSSLLVLHVEHGTAVRCPLSSDESMALMADDQTFFGVTGDGQLLTVQLAALETLAVQAAKDSTDEDAGDDGYVICRVVDGPAPQLDNFSGSFGASSGSAVLSPQTGLSTIVAGTPQSSTHLLVGSDRAIQVWDVQQRKLLLHAEPASNTTSFAFAAARLGCVVAVSSVDTRIFAYDGSGVGENYHCIPRVLVHEPGTIVTAAHVDDSFVFLGRNNGQVVMLDRVTGQLVRTIAQTLPPLKSSSSSLVEDLAGLDVSRKCNVVRRMGRYVLCAFEDGRFDIRDVRFQAEEEPPVSSYDSDGMPIRSVVVCPGGALVLGAWPSKKQIAQAEKKEKNKSLLRRPDAVVWRPRFDIAALLEDGGQVMGVHNTAPTAGQLIKQTPVAARGGILGALSLSCARVATLLCDFSVHYPRSDVDELASTCETAARSVAAAAELGRRGLATLPTPLLFQAQTVLDDYEAAVLRLRSSGRLSRFLGSTRLRLQIEQLNSRLARASDAISQFVEPQLSTLPDDFQEPEEVDEEEEESASVVEPKAPVAAKISASPGRRVKTSATVKRSNLSVSAAALWSEAAGGKRARSVSWEALRDTLLGAGGQSDRQESAESSSAGLRTLLDPCNTGYVSRFKFCELLRAFGPVTKVMEHVQSLFREPWFHGYLSSAEAELLLRNKPRGTFLVRVSHSSPGSLALAFTLGHQVHHVLLTTARPRGFKVRMGQQKGEQKEEKFATLHALVEHFRGQSLLSQPLTGFSLAPWFVGDLSREEADELFQSRPAGTFCVRFSSSQGPAPYTLCFVTPQGNKIRHVRIVQEADDCFYIENEQRAGKWSSVPDLIDTWQAKKLLKTPLLLQQK